MKTAMYAMVGAIVLSLGLATGPMVERATGQTIDDLEELVLVCYTVKKDQGTFSSETIEVKDQFRGERFVTLKTRNKAKRVCVFGVADQLVQGPVTIDN